jgi:hypothetical protein
VGVGRGNAHGPADMSRAMRLVQLHREWSPQERLDRMASLWFGRDWRRIAFEPGMQPVYIDAETRRVASGRPAKRRRQRG